MEKLWYYMKNEDEKKYGPYSDGELVSLIRNDIVRADDFIWMTDLKEWLKTGDSIYSIFIPQK